jgi:putative endonuclease
METGPRVRRGPGILAQARGRAGEGAASRYLSGLGYAILDRNFKTRFGEIDIVARDDQTTVFVEVKRRDASGHGEAAEFVNRSKMRKVVGAARVFAAKHGLSGGLIRFDVVAIDVIDGCEQLRHHKGAFDAS